MMATGGPDPLPRDGAGDYSNTRRDRADPLEGNPTLTMHAYRRFRAGDLLAFQRRREARRAGVNRIVGEALDAGATY